ncbi:MAG: LysR family transcriptional regulator, partial [Bacilli bacterium]|nr:LysR family transcriptional regulator [Bacilli bacterium]
MNLLDNKLETLLAVSEFKSFTTASKILNLTQPAVSQHISQLEKEFNIKIFNKTSAGLIPTKEG